MNHLVAVVGTTATGKTQMAVQLARVFGGEVVNADSRQIYRHMDIGTNKPTIAELASVPHHLIDIISPNDDFSLSEYQKLACRSINEIQSRNRLPLLVGGSGQYVWAVLEGWNIPHIAPNLELRKSLETQAAATGKETLYQELLRVDPEAAAKIGPHNTRRIIRALEVYHTAGIPISVLQKKEPPPYRTTIIGLKLEREELYRRIDARVDKMIASGLVAEVEKLLQMGYDVNLSSMSSIGYRQIVQYLRGEMILEDAVQQTKTETHRYARQQQNWFRLSDKRIHWFDAAGNIYPEVEAMLAESGLERKSP